MTEPLQKPSDEPAPKREAPRDYPRLEPYLPPAIPYVPGVDPFTMYRGLGHKKSQLSFYPTWPF